MEDFVPYELAVKLKEKGFREKCFAFYYKQGGFQWNCMRADTGLVNVSWACFNYNDIVNGDKINAPTISQVLKWLREEKKIFVIPSISPRINEEVKWDWDAGCFDNKKIFRWIDGNYGYNSYEQASLAGISWTLDNLI